VKAGKRKACAFHLGVTTVPEVENPAVSDPVGEVPPGFAGDFTSVALGAFCGIKANQIFFCRCAHQDASHLLTSTRVWLVMAVTSGS
jgi:hypothetical protein